MAALADESIFDKIKRFQSDMRAINWGEMPDEYARAIPENPNYGYLVDTQNYMREALMPYLERFGRLYLTRDKAHQRTITTPL